MESFGVVVVVELGAVLVDDLCFFVLPVVVPVVVSEPVVAGALAEVSAPLALAEGAVLMDDEAGGSVAIGAAVLGAVLAGGLAGGAIGSPGAGWAAVEPARAGML